MEDQNIQWYETWWVEKVQLSKENSRGMGVTVVKSALSSIRLTAVQRHYQDLKENITFLLRNWIVQTLVRWQIMMKRRAI